MMVEKTVFYKTKKTGFTRISIEYDTTKQPSVQHLID